MQTPADPYQLRRQRAPAILATIEDWIHHQVKWKTPHMESAQALAAMIVRVEEQIDKGYYKTG